MKTLLSTATIAAVMLTLGNPQIAKASDNQPQSDLTLVRGGGHGGMGGGHFGGHEHEGQREFHGSHETFHGEHEGFHNHGYHNWGYGGAYGPGGVYIEENNIYDTPDND